MSLNLLSIGVYYAVNPVDRRELNLVVAEVPLADHPGGVAEGGQQVGQ